MCLALRSHKNQPAQCDVLRLRRFCNLCLESGFHILKNAFLNAMMFLEVGLNCTLASNLDQFPNDWIMLRMGSGWCPGINTCSRLLPFFFFIHTTLCLLPKFESSSRMSEHSSPFPKYRRRGCMSALLCSSQNPRANVNDCQIWLKQNAMLPTNVPALFVPFSKLHL